MTKLIVKGIAILTALFIAMGLAGTVDRETEMIESQQEATEIALEEVGLWL